MAEDAQRGSPDENAAETAASGEPASEARSGTEKDGSSAERRSRKGPVLAAAVAAAAAGTTAVAANRALKSKVAGREAARDQEASPGSESPPEAESSLVSRAARKASKTSEPLVQALVETGWDTVKTSVTPTLERAAGAAGRFAATDAPEFLRETLLPPFVEAYEEARRPEPDTGS